MSSTDVLLMSAEEIGSYFLLLQCSWLAGEDCTLPNDPAKLAKLARVDTVSSNVLNKFSLDKDGRLFNQRLAQEWQEALKRSKDGKKAISARWKKDNGGNTTVSRSNYDSNTTNTNTHTNTNKVLKEDTKLSKSSSEEPSDPPQNPARPASGPARNCAESLAKFLGRTNLKPATVESWAQQVEPLLAHTDEQTIVAAMQWALTDSGDGFWRGRVLAMANFVRCFKTINQQRISGQKRTSGQKRGKAADPLAERCSSLKTGHDFSALAKGDL